MTGTPEDGINLRILVVCTGNLCRSPFAEHLLRRRLHELGLDDIEVASAGVSAVVGSPPPANVLQAAREWNLTLESHRARQVTADMVEAADLLLTMDSFQKFSLLTAFPEAAEKIHPLSQFDEEPGDDDVEDPMGMDLPGTREVFVRIGTCVDGVARYYAGP